MALKVSESGPETTPDRKVFSPLSTAARALQRNSSVGVVVRTSTAPPVTLRPNRMPWGPRSTSTASRSQVSRITPLLMPRYMPSRNTPTVGSMEGIEEFTPRPRMEKFAIPSEVPISSSWMFGA